MKHEFFIGVYDPGLDAALGGGDARLALGVGHRVQFDAQPRSIPAHALTDGYGVLPRLCQSLWCEPSGISLAA